MIAALVVLNVIASAGFLWKLVQLKRVSARAFDVLSKQGVRWRSEALRLWEMLTEFGDRMVTNAENGAALRERLERTESVVQAMAEDRARLRADVDGLLAARAGAASSDRRNTNPPDEERACPS